MRRPDRHDRNPDHLFTGDGFSRPSCDRPITDIGPTTLVLVSRRTVVNDNRLHYKQRRGKGTPHGIQHGRPPRMASWVIPNISAQPPQNGRGSISSAPSSRPQLREKCGDTSLFTICLLALGAVRALGLHSTVTGIIAHGSRFSGGPPVAPSASNCMITTPSQYRQSLSAADASPMFATANDGPVSRESIMCTFLFAQHARGGRGACQHVNVARESTSQMGFWNVFHSAKPVASIAVVGRRVTRLALRSERTRRE